jgi:hypothetical protein
MQVHEKKPVPSSLQPGRTSDQKDCCVPSHASGGWRRRQADAGAGASFLPSRWWLQVGGEVEVDGDPVCQAVLRAVSLGYCWFGGRGEGEMAEDGRRGWMRMRMRIQMRRGRRGR